MDKYELYHNGYTFNKQTGTITMVSSLPHSNNPCLFIIFIITLLLL